MFFFAIQNLVDIQSSRFRWYSFVFERTQSRLVLFLVNFLWPESFGGAIRPTGLLFYFQILFTKWPPATILNDRKSLSIAFLVILDQYATFTGNFFEFCSQNGRRRPFWMTENHFWSHLLPFQINAQLYFFWDFFTKWPPAAILDDRKSLSIAILAISDQYAAFLLLKFFTKWPPAAIMDNRKSVLIAFLAISDQYATFYF